MLAKLVLEKLADERDEANKVVDKFCNSLNLILLKKVKATASLHHHCAKMLVNTI